jgi:hypothetical protein
MIIHSYIPKIGEEYLLHKYPCSGLFKLPDDNYIIVAKSNNLYSWLAKTIVDEALLIENTSTVPNLEESSSAINDIIKVIAVTLKPELMKDRL